MISGVRFAFGDRSAAYETQRRRLHHQSRRGDRDALGHRLVADIDHTSATALVDVRQAGSG
jgi:hypothetical protein